MLLHICAHRDWPTLGKYPTQCFDGYSGSGRSLAPARATTTHSTVDSQPVANAPLPTNRIQHSALPRGDVLAWC